MVLEGNQNFVSALSFSPDGKLLASGDVSFLFNFLIFYFDLLVFLTTISFSLKKKSSGKILLFDVKERKVSNNIFRHYTIRSSF